MRPALDGFRAPARTRRRCVIHARPVLVVTLLVAIAVPVGASARVHWGPRAGVNASAFSGDLGDLVRPDVRYFPNLGVALQVDMARNVSFRTEVAYSVKGGGSESQGTDPSGNPTTVSKDTWRFDYIEFPLLVRTRMPLGTRAAPYLEVGPSVAFALRGEFHSEGSGLPKLDLRDGMQDVDVGFGGGFGIELPAGPVQAALEVRYTRGLDDLMKGAGLSIINQTWTFAATFMY